MGNVYSLDVCSLILYSRKKSGQEPFNEFYFVNTFCIDKNVKEMTDIAIENGYTYNVVHYINRDLSRIEVFFPKNINFYTYKYDDNIVEYATIG